MAEELQHLIDRIRNEAVAEGEKQADTLLAQAKEKAAKLVKDAEQQAKQTVEKAKQDAEAYTVRSKATLQQAARDLLISVGQGVENILADIVDGAVDQALDTDTIRKMLVKMTEAYFAKGGQESGLEVLVSPEDQDAIKRFFSEQYHQKLQSGELTVHADKDLFKGFRVGVKGDAVYHDFSAEAIAESLSNFLRPQLAEIVHSVADGQNGKKDA